MAAAMAGDFEKARQFTDPDKAVADQVADIPEMLKGQNLRIMAVVADDSDAIAVSSVILGDHERIGPLVFLLDRRPQDGRDNWWVDDIDLETPDGAEAELKRFLEKHPKAQKVAYENIRAVEVEGTGITAESEPEFSAILPNGVTVELIGMCEYPSVDKQWWWPDGSLLADPPYDESDIDILSFRKPNTIPIEFAFRLSGKLGEPAWEARVKADDQAFVWWTGRRARDGKFLTDIKSIGMFVKSDRRTQDLRLGFSFADRPYEWVDFKNISVKPSFEPNVQVEGEEISSVIAPDAWTWILPSKDVMRLIALFRPKDNPIVFWDPEGIIIEGPRLAMHNFANASGSELAYVLQRPEREYKDGHETPAPDGNFYDVGGWSTYELESTKSPTIRHAIGYGDWVDAGRIEEGEDSGNYNLTEIQESKGLVKRIRAKMFWKFDPEFGIRLVAVDKKSKEYPMAAQDEFQGFSKSSKGQRMLYYQSAMGITKKELSRLILQRRPLAWAEFSGFATEPRKPVVEADVKPNQVEMDVCVVEVYSDVKLDWETRVAAKNITDAKVTSNAKPGKTLSAAGILRAAAKMEPQTEKSVERLVDLLVSRVYLKILMNPRIEVLDGKTAKIESSWKRPGGYAIVDLFEITPRIVDDGSIDLAAKMVYRNKQMGDPESHLNIKNGASRIIGSITRTVRLLTRPCAAAWAAMFLPRNTSRI